MYVGRPLSTYEIICFRFNISPCEDERLIATGVFLVFAIVDGLFSISVWGFDLIHPPSPFFGPPLGIRNPNRLSTAPHSGGGGSRSTTAANPQSGPICPVLASVNSRHGLPRLGSARLARRLAWLSSAVFRFEPPLVEGPEMSSPDVATGANSRPPHRMNQAFWFVCVWPAFRYYGVSTALPSSLGLFCRPLFRDIHVYRPSFFIFLVSFFNLFFILL